MLSGTVHKGYRTRPQHRGVRSPAGASQTAEETIPGVHFALEAFEMFICTSGTGRDRQGKPGCYCSEEEPLSQLHRAVDVCSCYLGGMLSSWSSSAQFQTPSGSGTRG